MALLPLLFACTPLKLDPPTSDKQTLLILPATHTKNAESNKPGFYYVYEITSDDNRMAPFDAVIKYPLADDMVLVDSLPPGDYHVSKFSFFPMGVGDHTYGDNSYPMNEPFTLLPGTITIFPKSFNQTTYNSIPGRGATTSYSFEIKPVSEPQSQQIIDTLSQLENFQSWKLVDTSNPHIARAQGSWAGKWESTNSKDCGNGRLRARVTGAEMSGSASSATGESFTISATIDNRGKVTGELSSSEGRIATVYGGVYQGGEIAGTLTFEDGCKSDWSVLKKD
jgi:hypothetical protein